MKKIEVFGTGCAKCKQTNQLINKVVDETGAEAEVVKVEDINEIVNRGVMIIPAVFVDGKKKCAGKIPTVKEIKTWLALD